jgi:hypothetical protein
VVVFPFAFHIAVQQPFGPLWSRLLLHDHEPSRASFALCFMTLLMSLLPASGEFLFGFPSPRRLSSSGSYPFDLSGLGDPTGSNATASLALSHWNSQAPLPWQGGDTNKGGWFFIVNKLIKDNTLKINVENGEMCDLQKDSDYIGHQVTINKKTLTLIGRNWQMECLLLVTFLVKKSDKLSEQDTYNNLKLNSLIWQTVFNIRGLRNKTNELLCHLHHDLPQIYCV